MDMAEFKNKIQSLQEVNIGDFRRKISLYINRLSESDEGLRHPKTMIQMKNTVLYSGLTDADEILEQLMEQTKNISE